MNTIIRDINKSTVGTLEGLARDAIKRNEIVPEDEFVQNILEQPYDEGAALNRGGTYKRRKTRRVRKTRRTRRTRK